MQKCFMSHFDEALIVFESDAAVSDRGVVAPVVGERELGSPSRPSRLSHFQEKALRLTHPYLHLHRKGLHLHRKGAFDEEPRLSKVLVRRH